ncbi:hypothetical protein [Geodermatophilus sp. URMC 62]|uniref:hypothetical protein n=1 Tax=Geodermatophilus sp. URMC 62 TaxID=3423414 RepID=UPI00406CA5CE
MGHSETPAELAAEGGFRAALMLVRYKRAGPGTPELSVQDILRNLEDEAKVRPQKEAADEEGTRTNEN